MQHEHLTEVTEGGGGCLESFQVFSGASSLSVCLKGGVSVGRFTGGGGCADSMSAHCACVCVSMSV